MTVHKEKPIVHGTVNRGGKERDRRNTYSEYNSKYGTLGMSLRSGLAREVAFSTPERDRGSDRDRNCDASSLPSELPAPRKRQARNTIKQSGRYRRPLSQPDLSANDSDTIPIANSQPDP
ncbi:hypothetical protein BU23DRAFT_190573 [Bimuria novae-zelandiae CBS 107.79]|uniref:Uncharacterized protein n=1 Tax=Bimuria novae-zelandiae CBS 107.79 TaxID=1447943 RepID=A0A6A5VQQ2_9PLEO|nr:hypothetical protein BU23DRAFT_190573 [Bimuria novae-zelandiae CBS 107.79]